MGAGNDGQRTARIEADDHAVVEYRRLLDEIADAAPAQLAVLLRFGGALGKAVPVGELEAFIHDVDKIAAVIDQAGLNLVRHGRDRNHVAPPDLDRVDSNGERGAVE